MGQGPSLRTEVGELDSKIEALQRTLSEARHEIEQANLGIDQMHHQQAALSSQVNELQSEMAHLRADQEERRQELSQQIGDIQGRLMHLQVQQNAQTTLLQQLLAADRERQLQEELEHQYSLFLIKIGRIRSQIKDGAVLLLFARQVLRFCQDRKISTDAFRRLSDMQVAEGELQAIRAVELSVRDEDKATADNYEAISKIVAEIAAEREAIALARRTLDILKSRQEAERPRALAELARLEVPETDDDRQMRRARFWIFALAGPLPAATLAVLWKYGKLADMPPAVPILIAAVSLLLSELLAFQNADAARSGRLDRARWALAECDAQMNAIDAEFASLERRTGESIETFNDRLDALTHESRDSHHDLTLQYTYGRADHWIVEWRRNHYEISYIGLPDAPALLEER